MKDLSTASREELLEEMIHMAGTKGLVSGTSKHGEYCHVPMTLLPAMFSRTVFETAVTVNPIFNLLVDRIARDIPWLHSTLKKTGDADPFTGKLLNISEQVQKDGLAQSAYFGIFRSDYMLNKSDQRLLQVELNTIAASFGGLMAGVSEWHKFAMQWLMQKHLNEHDDNILKSFYGESQSDINSALPSNPALESIPAGIAFAHEYYIMNRFASALREDKAIYVLFVVQKDERNFADQRSLEFALLQSHGISVIRKTLTELTQDLAIRNTKLFVCEKEISVVYFRAGYTPNDYPTEKEWKVRLSIEKSFAIKCPSVAYQLVGAKKIQQVLNTPNVLHRFLSKTEAELVSIHFAGQWALGPGVSNADELAVSEAKKFPENYVMKPQREGGGNNLYGIDIKNALENMSPEELSAYVLMQRIYPQPAYALLAREGKVRCVPSVQELGIYGCFMSLPENNVLMNKGHCGQLLRTKALGVDEGGVATGYSCLDSPFLV